jgi:hypothetical protein
MVGALREQAELDPSIDVTLEAVRKSLLHALQELP